MIHVFVYGTLQPGEAYHRPYCEPHLVEATPALTRGHLYHLPVGYPALTEGTDWVAGSLLTLRDEAALAALDRFEGYDAQLPADDNEYERRQWPVFSRDRLPLGSAWMYRMTPAQVRQRGGLYIPAGTWSRAQWPSITPR